MSDTSIDFISSSSSGKTAAVATARVHQVNIKAQARPKRKNLNFIGFSKEQLLAGRNLLTIRGSRVVRLVVEERHHHNHYTPYQSRGAESSSCGNMVGALASVVTTCTSVSKPRSSLRSQNHGSLNDVSSEQEGNNCLGMTEMGNSVSSYRYKGILASRSVPILFVLICFLIIANTSCDHVGSSNAGAELSPSKENNIDSDNNKDYQQKQREPMKPRIKSFDPLSMLREIYLDNDSKIITMLAPQTDTVQKFHPNGRYGRRSMDIYAEPHAELGQLANEDQLDQTRSSFGGSYEARSSDSSSPLRRILYNLDRGDSMAGAGSDGDQQNDRVQPARDALQLGNLFSTPGPLVDGPPAEATSIQGKNSHQNTEKESDNVFSSNGAQVANLQLEMNKLLKCNYSGVFGLYWCGSGRTEARRQTRALG